MKKDLFGFSEFCSFVMDDHVNFDRRIRRNHAFHTFSRNAKCGEILSTRSPAHYFAMQMFFGSVKSRNASSPRKLSGPTDGRPACDLFGDTHVLCFGEKSQGLFTTLPTNPACLHPAERDAEIAHEPAVHPDGAGGDSFGDAMGTIEILCPDARG